MRNIRDDENLCAGLSKAALARAEDFSWDSVTDRYVALYRDMIAEHAAACQGEAA